MKETEQEILLTAASSSIAGAGDALQSRLRTGTRGVRHSGDMVRSPELSLRLAIIVLISSSGGGGEGESV
jgi:hypothetical protein